MLFYLPKKEVQRVGFTATKKIGNAVRRNRAKRRMRAMVLACNEALREGSYILVAKAQMQTLEFDRLCNDLKKALKRIHTPKRR